MNMKVFKLISSIVLVLSMALPLSTCKGPVADDGSYVAEDTQRYVITSDSSVDEWLWAISFILPFIVSLISLARTLSIKTELFSVVSTAPVAMVLYSHAITGKLAIGGWLAVVSGGVFILVALVNLVKMLNKLKQQGPAAGTR